MNFCIIVRLDSFKIFLYFLVNGSVPDNLQYVEMSIYQDVEKCEAFNNTFLQSTMLCAGNEAADACVVN